jgi:hypothetical protein
LLNSEVPAVFEDKSNRVSDLQQNHGGYGKVLYPHYPLLLSGSKDHAAETEQGESEVDTANHSHCCE